MPLILHNIKDRSEIGLWKISEELEELETLADLSLSDSNTFSGISAIHRKKEWLATRALLIELTGERTSIKYHNDGRPYPDNSKYYISISHTTGFVAIMLHQFNLPGIDIELASRQVSRVASRFLSPEEYEVCRNNAGFFNRKLLLHWCAKEAIFKMVPFSDIEFSTDIQIKLGDSILDSGTFQGQFTGKPEPVPIALEYLEKEGVIMVWGSTGKFG